MQGEQSYFVHVRNVHFIYGRERETGLTTKSSRKIVWTSYRLDCAAKIPSLLSSRAKLIEILSIPVDRVKILADSNFLE
jgi:hypothetical protein